MYRRLNPFTLSLSIGALILGASPLFAASQGLSRNGSQVNQRVRLMSQENERSLRSLLPQVDDAWVTSVLEDPQLILYTDREMPPAYQDWGSGLTGVHSPSYNISADGGEPHGNGNVEFPWGDPAGTHRSPNVGSFRFLLLPRNDQGRTMPIVWYRTRLPGDSSQGYAWLFPEGSVLGEVLMLRSPKGESYVFELRLRIRELDDWDVNVFRPFPTAHDLASGIRRLKPDWKDEESLVRLVNHLEQPIELTKLTLANRHPLGQVFRQTMGVDSLPPIGDDALTAKLLRNTVFKSARDCVWRHDEQDNWTAAPTTKARFHVIPTSYDGGFIPVDRDSCARCHDTTSKHVNQFQPGRDWYGHIRGSDGIFTFHPFHPGSISHNGYGQSVMMRTQLVDAGLLEPFDESRHSASHYQRTFRFDNGADSR